MRKLTVEIGKKIHEIVYIEYQNNIPFEAITTNFVPTAKEPYWCCYHWSFFLEKGDKLDLRAYNYGFGGNIQDIEASQWADGYTGIFWLRNDLSLKGNLKNGKRIENPLRIKGYTKSSINPFKIAEIAYCKNYCSVCNEYSEDYCWEHIYEDKDSNLKYKHDKSFIDE